MSTLLLLFACSFAHIAQSSSKCPNITLSQCSTTVPVVSNGTNYTLYQEFVTDRDVQDLNITWTRIPFPLDPSTENVKIENSVIDSRTLRASLILWDIQVVPTNGDYTVTASNGCGVSNKTVFYLHVDVSCSQDNIPQPLILENSTVLAEPALQEVLLLTVTFYGPSDKGFVTLWRLGTSHICLEESEFHSTRFSCDRKVLGPCWFKANLWIENPSYASSGQYSVFATDSSDEKSNSSTVYLSVVMQPQVQSCSTASLTADTAGHAEFQCQLSNYSDYVQVVVVEDNEREYNESTRDLSFGCEAQTREGSSLATCTVSISSSAHSGKREYRLCAGYNNSVVPKTQPLCSGSVTVNFSGPSDSQSLRNGLIAGGAVVLLLSLLLVASILACVAYRRRSGSSMSINDPARPLLHPPADLTLQRDSSPAGTSGKKGSSPRQPDTPDLDVDHDYQSSGVVVNTGAQGPGRGSVSLWKRVRPGPLEREELVHTARAIPRWSSLARYLGLSEPVIVAISENYRGDYEEQKFQMLLKWYQQQLVPPARQTLIRIIEERMGSELAQDIVNIVGTSQDMPT